MCVRLAQETKLWKKDNICYHYLFLVEGVDLWNGRLYVWCSCPLKRKCSRLIELQHILMPLQELLWKPTPQKKVKAEWKKNKK